MRSSLRDAVIIYNPLAGGGHRHRRHQLERAGAILAREGIEAELQPTEGPGGAAELARRAVEQRRQLVIVCGGDGTVNEAVNGLAGSRVPLAVFPAGTANVLAKELGIPWNIERAAGLVAISRPQRIALGLATALPAGAPQRYFLCVAGAGPDGVLIYGTRVEHKLRLGILAYWLEGFHQLFRYGYPAFRTRVSDRTLAGTLVVVGRTRHYGGPFCITTGASLFEDSFEIAVCARSSSLGYLSLLPAAALGRLQKSRGMQYLKTTRLRCEPMGDDVVYAQVDGEPAGRLPVEFSIVPDALTLMIPPGIAIPEPAAGPARV